MDVLAIILTALLAGWLLGTGINILATRLPSDQPLFGPPLTSSNATPAPQQIIPYAGTWFGGDGIDWPNLATQLGAAAVVGTALGLHGFSLAAVQAIILSTILLTILRIDWQHHSIYLITIWPGIFLALVLALLSSPSRLLSASVAGALAAAFFLVLFFLAIVIYRKRALGLGDVFLAALIGTMVGLEWITHALLLGMLLAAVGGLFLVAIRVKKRTDYIPYGAYLSLGAMIIVMITA